MIGRAAVIVLVFLCAATPAGAQLSATDLQAVAAADAQQYGVPVQLFLDQIQAESGFNPGAVNNRSGALGIAQFLPSTAANPGYGIAPFDPTNPAAALSAAAQYDAALAAANGGNWTAALTAYSGGLTPANPGDYGAVFADAAAASGGGGTITVAANQDFEGGGSDPIAAAATGGGTYGPFGFLLNEYFTAIVGPLNYLLGSIQTWVAGLIIYLIALLGMSLAVRIWAGELDFGNLVIKALIVAVVLGMEGAGSIFYQNYVINVFGGLSGSLGSQIIGVPSANIGSFLDNIWHGFYSDLPTITWNLPGFGLTQSVLDAFLEVLAIAGVLLALIVTFFEWFRATFILQIMFILGPLFLPAAMFDGFRAWAWRWLNTMISLVLAAVTAQIMVWIVVKVIIDQFPNIPGGTQGTQQAGNLLGAVAVFIAVAWLTHEVRKEVQALGAGAGGRSNAPGYGEIAGAAATGAGRAGRVAGAFL